MKKSASIVKVRSLTELYLWLDKIPCYITTRDQEKLIEDIRNKKEMIVLWTELYGFRTW